MSMDGLLQYFSNSLFIIKAFPRLSRRNPLHRGYMSLYQLCIVAIPIAAIERTSGSFTFNRPTSAGKTRLATSRWRVSVCTYRT